MTPLDSVSLTKFILETLEAPAEELSNDTLLFSDGILDSFNLLELVQFVESKLDRKIPARDIALANFDSINKILSFAERKRSDK